MSMKFNNKEIENITFNSKEVLKVIFNGTIVYEKSSGEWKLSDDRFIIGDDGKYYQYLYQGEIIPAKGSVDLNNQWGVDTVSTESVKDSNFNYYMSTSNYNVNNGYAQMQIKWSGLTSITLKYRSYAESNYDYVVIRGLDQPKFTSNPTYSTSGVIYHTRGSQTTTFKTATINCDEGEHFIWVCYRKDSSSHTNSDRGFLGVSKDVFENTEIITATKKGLELPYEYIKSDEYIFVDDSHIRYKYYKIYYTPNGEAHKSDLYEYGDVTDAHPFDPSLYCRFTAKYSCDLYYSVVGQLQMGKITTHTGTGFIENEQIWNPNEKIHLNTGQSIWVRNDCTGEEQTSSKYYRFYCESVSTLALYIDGGNIGNLKNNAGKYKYHRMFFSLKTLENVDNECMPNEPLTDDCFYEMFRDCANLKTAPALPATTLASNCYSYMFYGCKSLTTAPELPATTLADSCYMSMFSNCTSLTVAPELPATTLRTYCYSSMFYNCSKLTQAPSLPATTLADYCYSHMFESCSSLTTAPTLTATTLASYCYGSMFYGCKALTTAPELPATTLRTDCYSDMFRGCTALTVAPELPATTLRTGCYNGMFIGCSKLNYVKAMFTTTPSTSYTSNWLSGVASSGTFVKNSAATWTTTGASAVPTGWTVEYADA